MENTELYISLKLTGEQLNISFSSLKSSQMESR